MSLAYPDRAGPLSTCPGKFPENVRVPCPRVHNTLHTIFLKNLGIKTPKLVLFELGTTADCTAVDLLVHSSTRVRKIPSTYPDCNTRWIYTTASQGLIGGFTFRRFAYEWEFFSRWEFFPRAFCMSILFLSRSKKITIGPGKEASSPHINNGLIVLIS